MIQDFLTDLDDVTDPISQQQTLRATYRSVRFMSTTLKGKTDAGEGETKWSREEKEASKL